MERRLRWWTPSRKSPWLYRNWSINSCFWRNVMHWWAQALLDQWTLRSRYHSLRRSLLNERLQFRKHSIGMRHRIDRQRKTNRMINFRRNMLFLRCRILSWRISKTDYWINLVLIIRIGRSWSMRLHTILLMSINCCKLFIGSYVCFAIIDFVFLSCLAIQRDDSSTSLVWRSFLFSNYQLREKTS